MTLQQFCQQARILEAKELEKVKFLAFYNHKTTGKSEFTKEDILAWLESLHLPKPNPTRLLSKIRASKAFVKGKGPDSFKLHALELDQLQAEYPGIHAKTEEIVSDDTILPHPLYQGTRGFVESLAKQINASYEYNIFDGCAVLMRRLLEILLILSFEHLNIEGEIQDSNKNYFLLGTITNKAISSSKLKLSRDSKDTLNDFRTLGNFSAHKIYYNSRRADLKKVTSSYRATIEELLYKSGIKK